MTVWNQVFVFDLDDVIRTFDPARADSVIEGELGLPAGSVAEAAFGGPELQDAIEGRITFEQWSETIAGKLARQSGRPAEVAEVFGLWVSYRGDLVHETVELLDELNAAGVPVFALTNGTTRIPDEIAQHGLTEKFRRVLNSAELGVTKPDVECFRRAHAEIERTLGEPIAVQSVTFADDRTANVAGAIEYGWRAFTYTTADRFRTDVFDGAARTPVLVNIGGLPATGKSTIARSLARELGAAYVRVDSIETAVGRAEGRFARTNDWELPPGYEIGYDVVADQLRTGLDVVAESVNASHSSRDAWRDAALGAGGRVVEVEVVCSAAAEHRRRAEEREIDIVGLTKPTWAQITSRAYEPWSRDRIVVDTAALGADEAVREIGAHLPLPLPLRWDLRFGRDTRAYRGKT